MEINKAEIIDVETLVKECLAETHEQMIARLEAVPLAAQPRIYMTPALPLHYVGVMADGSQWLIPVSPTTPSPWLRKKPYRGNYALTLCPDYIQHLYRMRFEDDDTTIY